MGKINFQQIIDAFRNDPKIKAAIEKENRWMNELNRMNLKMSELKASKATGLISDEDEQYELGKIQIQLDGIERKLKSELPD